jgi:large subunit ribosomal protein L19
VSRTPIIEELEKAYLKKDLPLFNVGDTIRVQTRVIEGEKERVQAFTGTVIAKKGSGLSETFSLYRHAYGSNMERVFLLHSPRITQIEVIRSGKVRRAKLYYMRGRSGKAMKVREQFAGAETVEALAPEVPVEETPKG